MMSRARALSFGGMAFLLSISCSANAQDCTGYLANKFVEAKTNASNCGVSAGLMGSIDAPSPQPGLCRSGAQRVQSQLGAFQACGAVYYCAAEAYRCAMRRVASGTACQTAMQDCLAENPVPRIQ